jgi:hypothetical protein
VVFHGQVTRKSELFGSQKMQDFCMADSSQSS